MSNWNSKILTPIDIKGSALRNRLAVAPMTRVSATELGQPTQAMAQYYERFARGGFGLVITEGIYTDDKFSQGYPFQPGIIDAGQADAWRTVTDQIHSHGGVAFAQLMHAGALNQGNRFTQHSAAPSAIRPKGEQMQFYYGEGQYRIPEPMSDEQIADAIAGFARAAQLAATFAGFDGVEIHGANGYLLDQFLTDYTNHRSDRWGGATQNRIALALEVIKAVKASVPGTPVGIRISQSKVNDYFHKWAEGEKDAEVIFGSLSDASVDFIHVTEFEAWQPAFAGGNESLVKLARRYAPTTPLLANGGLHDPAHAEKALTDGADILTLGKSALANPDFPQRLAHKTALCEFDAAILGPIANIKASELANA